MSGLEYASLSLGMELSFAVGKSIYAKQNNLPYHVYVLLGDAECNEGSIWEAVLTAGHYKLDNLACSLPAIKRSHPSHLGFETLYFKIEP